MPNIIFITHKGVEHVVEGTVGQNLMQVATINDVPGIDADCGGSCTCGTCQVFVDETWWNKVDAPDSGEAAMLEFVNMPQPNSRLACQIRVTDALSGLIVRIPESQQ